MKMTLDKPERVRLLKSKKAPFTGQLLSDVAVAKLLSDHEAVVARLKAEVKYLAKQMDIERISNQKVCTARVNAEKAKLKAAESTCKSREFVYIAAVKRTAESCERRWYESPYLSFILGATIASIPTVAYIAK